MYIFSDIEEACQDGFYLSFCPVILNEVKDLSLIYAIKRFFAYAQNDRLYLNEIANDSHPAFRFSPIIRR